MSEAYQRSCVSHVRIPRHVLGLRPLLPSSLLLLCCAPVRARPLLHLPPPPRAQGKKDEFDAAFGAFLAKAPAGMRFKMQSRMPAWGFSTSQYFDWASANLQCSMKVRREQRRRRDPGCDAQGGCV